MNIFFRSQILMLYFLFVNSIMNTIIRYRVHGGDPEPAQALAKANYRIFNGRGESFSKPNYLILITKSMRNEEEVLKEANKLKIQGTRVLGVGKSNNLLI